MRILAQDLPATWKPQLLSRLSAPRPEGNRLSLEAYCISSRPKLGYKLKLGSNFDRNTVDLKSLLRDHMFYAVSNAQWKEYPFHAQTAQGADYSLHAQN